MEAERRGSIDPCHGKPVVNIAFGFRRTRLQLMTGHPPLRSKGLRWDRSQLWQTSPPGMRVRLNSGQIIPVTQRPLIVTDADANNDLCVDFGDFQILERNFGKAGDKSQGDFDGDRDIDEYDFLILRKLFGQCLGETNVQTGALPVSVPEPGGLAGLLCAALIFGRRCGRSASRSRF